METTVARISYDFKMVYMSLEFYTLYLKFECVFATYGQHRIGIVKKGILYGLALRYFPRSRPRHHPALDRRQGEEEWLFLEENTYCDHFFRS